MTTEHIVALVRRALENPAAVDVMSKSQRIAVALALVNPEFLPSDCLEPMHAWLRLKPQEVASIHEAQRAMRGW